MNDNYKHILSFVVCIASIILLSFYLGIMYGRHDLQNDRNVCSMGGCCGFPVGTSQPE